MTPKIAPMSEYLFDTQWNQLAAASAYARDLMKAGGEGFSAEVAAATAAEILGLPSQIVLDEIEGGEYQRHDMP